MVEMAADHTRTHPGPLCIRTSPESTLPLDPGYLALNIPPLTETERAAAWENLLSRAGMSADFDRLASRYRIGPGIIRKVITTLSAVGPSRGDASTWTGMVLASRLENTAHAHGAPQRGQVPTPGAS